MAAPGPLEDGSILSSLIKFNLEHFITAELFIATPPENKNIFSFVSLCASLNTSKRISSTKLFCAQSLYWHNFSSDFPENIRLSWFYL